MSDNQPTLPGLGVHAPVDEDYWFSKEFEISQLFSPTHPVKERDLFVGRSTQVSRFMDAIFQDGQHIVVYGDRGVGKTSLINTMIQRIFAKSTRVKFFSAQCFGDDDYVKIWERVLKDHVWANGDYAIDDIDSALDPDGLLSVIDKFPRTMQPVFVFDEFDRVTDGPTKTKMAETIKLFSDRSAESTIVIAGVAKTIQELFLGHESVLRALRQIEMPRMRPDELQDIIKKRVDRAGMTIDAHTQGTIVWASRGMPAYTHLLGKNSALAAIKNHSLHINDDNFYQSLQTCLEDAGASTRQAYFRATHSSKPNNLNRQALLACAMATPDDVGSFTAASVRAPLSTIMGKERDIPDFSRHLKAFCSQERGAILQQEGTPKNYRYRFTDPMMQPYVIMMGLKDRMLGGFIQK
ncbi:MAG: ATP-binding protein [Proteobacteria bacterium]|nr:ATP-binding protein [Pseudomonadota bacterium]